MTRLASLLVFFLALVPCALAQGSTGRYTHTARPGETLWGIARENGITYEQLLEVNPAMRADGFQLKEGMAVTVPTAGYAALRTAVLLPLTSGREEARRSLEFYRGYLLAAEAMKKNGGDHTVYAHDEPAPGAGDLEALFAQLRQQRPQLLIGPLYPAHFAAVGQFCQKEGIKWVVPFSSKVDAVRTQRNLFLLNAPEAQKAAFAAKLFEGVFPNAKVVILRTTGGNEQFYADELVRHLRAAGYETGEVPAGCTKAQMIAAVSVRKTTVFVPDGSGELHAREALAALTGIKQGGVNENTALMGFPEWLGYAPQLRESLYQANSYIFTHSFYNPYDPATQSFERNYKALFGSALLDVTPRMALLGHDMGMYLLDGLQRYGAAFATQPVHTRTLQSQIDFVRTATGGGLVNASMQFIHFRTDRSIEKLAPAM